MAEASIPVDIFNAGQVFACLGFAEASEQLLGDAEGAFDWSNRAQARFLLRAPGEENPFAVVLRFISHATVHAIAPAASRNSAEKWGVETRALPLGAPFPFPDPTSPATLPAVLEGELKNGPPSAEASTKRLVLDHWGDDARSDATKFWAGAGGYPGAARARDALDLVRERCEAAAADPFSLSAPQTSSFSFDWRRDYIPLDAGFSLNNHVGLLSAVGYPLVELLASLGLSNARPARVENDKLRYRYGVLGSAERAETNLFALPLMRAALGVAPLPFERRVFQMFLGWSGKEGQARAITNVTEENFR